MISLNNKGFQDKIDKNEDFIIYKKVKNIDIDPIKSFVNTINKKKYSFIYESVEGGIHRGRYSICGFDPLIILKINNKIANLYKKKSGKLVKIKQTSKNPFENLEHLIASLKIKISKSLPPMASGVFGYLGYEAINYLEEISKNKKTNNLNLPDCLLFYPRTLFIYDNHQNDLYIVKAFIKNTYTKSSAKYDLICDEMLENKKYITEYIPDNIKIDKSKKLSLNAKSNISKDSFYKNIEKSKKYIRNGDIFQIVPSHRFEMDFKYSAAKLYEVLRETNPSPFMYLFNFPGFNIVGSSPEILVRVRDNKVTIRPIAGTRPRGKSKKEDLKNEKDLLNDAKELSEHMMLLDLGRNDVGRVVKAGSVKITSSFGIEKYSHVMHIVSNVEGELKNDKTLIDALMAGFPAGTVTGAPKIRAMEIIDELEVSKRGPYAGAVGYFSSMNEMDTCIVLRTGIIQNKKLYVQAGGGVVYDSKANYEYEETINKSMAVIGAAEIVNGNNQ